MGGLKAARVLVFHFAFYGALHCYPNPSPRGDGFYWHIEEPSRHAGFLAIQWLSNIAAQ